MTDEAGLLFSGCARLGEGRALRLARGHPSFRAGSQGRLALAGRGGMGEEGFEDDDREESAARKRELAIEFIRRIRAMDREELHALILHEAGEDLARFFLAYATDLMQREPHRAVENASSLLLIGYLIRGHELDLEERMVDAQSAWLH
jgi:hypothetical protein